MLLVVLAGMEAVLWAYKSKQQCTGRLNEVTPKS